MHDDDDTEKWESAELGSLVSITSGGTPSKECAQYWGGTIPWVTAKDMKTFELLGSELTVTDEGTRNGTRTVPPNSILVLVRGMTLLKDVPICLAAVETAFNQDIRALQVKQGIDARFLAYSLTANKERLRERVDIAGHGTGRLSTEMLTEFPIRFPTRLIEQKAIAAVLSAWDRAIERTAALIAAKDRLKQGLMQQLLSGRRRFPKFRGEPFRPTPLDTVLSKVSRAVDVEPSKTYREIGIRSHGKGIFHKEPVHGETLGEKRVYEVVPGCLALNIVFAWERAIAITSTRESGMIASHRFPMFQPNPEKVVIEYVLHYLLSDVGSHVLKLASPGGAGRNRTISQEQLLKTVVPLPSVAEQRRIVETVKAAEDEVMSLRTALTALKQQKRGLMQQLLTGQRRVSPSLIKRCATS